MLIINRSEHKRIDFTSSVTLFAGAVVIVGGIKGYTTGACVADKKSSLVIEGVCEGPKASGESWSKGERLYWDAENSVFTKTATDNELVGCVESDATTDDTEGRVLWDCSIGGDGADGAAGSVPGGSYTVLQADDDAGTKAIDTGLSTISSFNVQILRSGVSVTGDAVLSAADGTITVADGSTYALTAGDVINWLAAGTV